MIRSINRLTLAQSRGGDWRGGAPPGWTPRGWSCCWALPRRLAQHPRDCGRGRDGRGRGGRDLRKISEIREDISLSLSLSLLPGSGSLSLSGSGSATALSSTGTSGWGRLFSEVGRSRLSGKMRLPKSTVNLLHQTEIHLRSPTFMLDGRVSVIISSSDRPRTGALWSLYL